MQMLYGYTEAGLFIDLVSMFIIGFLVGFTVAFWHF